MPLQPQRGYEVKIHAADFNRVPPTRLRCNEAYELLLLSHTMGGYRSLCADVLLIK